MSADTTLMPIPGPVDPVPVPRRATSRADGRVELVGLSKPQIREELEGRLVIGVVNFPQRRIATFDSEVLVLGAIDDEKGVVLLRPDDDVAVGDRIG